ncbi:hypothetical protein M7959_01015 [Enterobacter hormaechei subsp. xiangfangensis]|uniref:hypothetical protein n=1 Tax=Enterobacter cloacae complex TaxID=354276 RepID=UPI000F8207A4|nr:hypothetical protein [Enterobacter hormaechei]KAA0880082.1 hypothetical protein EYC94_17995 [Enterobacter hormaechei]MCL1415744.1 hypothetical protein [Enterobacter hormaechei]MCL1420875.1 hypothetical protein [Enterobacter hormaechei]MCM8488116.1 hypothetical protein [Enterobacter hormaechei]MCW4976777.1 hypothetical protein [Enterobacter hormaechei subsp. xiangfangensis]
MTNYNFDSVNTDVPVNHEEVSYALLAVLAALGKSIAGDDPKKQEALLKNLEHAYMYNNGLGNNVDVEIARMAKNIKAAL